MTAPTLGSADQATLLDELTRRAEAAGTVVHRVDSLAAVVGLARELAGDDGDVCATPPLLAAPELVALGSRLVDPRAGSVDRDVAVGLERGELAVAETGSVLVREPDLAHRLPSMLSRVLVQVVDAAAVVPTLDAVGEWLVAHAREGYAALVTGPSRTADIERQITVGVQGPFEVHLAIVGGVTEGQPS